MEQDTDKSSEYKEILNQLNELKMISLSMNEILVRDSEKLNSISENLDDTNVKLSENKKSLEYISENIKNKPSLLKRLKNFGTGSLLILGLTSMTGVGTIPAVGLSIFGGSLMTWFNN